MLSKTLTLTCDGAECKRRLKSKTKRGLLRDAKAAGWNVRGPHYCAPCVAEQKRAKAAA